MNVRVVEHARELNKALAVIRDLSFGAPSPRLSSVVLACQQSVLGGGLADYAATVDLAIRTGLIVKRADDGLTLTSTGEQFLIANPRDFYEIQSDQKVLLTQLLVEDGPFRRAAASLFSRLRRAATPPPLRLPRGEVAALSEPEASCFRVLVFLEILGLAEDYWYVQPGYTRLAARLRASPRVGEEVFAVILEERARLGRAAEMLVVEYERSRLRALEATTEALLVSRVSEIDVGAGYDVDSFHGVSGRLQPDRFVEVKASASAHLRFFWTRNEYETAVKLEADYFIYFLAAFDPALGVGGVNVRMIQDPVRTLPNLPNLKIEPEVYLVEERAEDVVEISALTANLRLE